MKKPELELENKFILDACCGNRQFWFDKSHPNTLYIDNRREQKGFIKERPNICVEPDIVMDFRDLKFPDKTFRLVVWDPPHCRRSRPLGIITKKYGCLNPETWAHDIKQGFNELWRVLKDYGVLVFKWNGSEIPLDHILELLPEKPLFGHPTNSNNKTYWCCFMKIPPSKNRASHKTEHGGPE